MQMPAAGAAHALRRRLVCGHCLALQALRFVSENSYVFSERHQTTLYWDAILAWPSSSRLSVEANDPAATPARTRGVDGDGGGPRTIDDRRRGAGCKGSRATLVGHHAVSSRQKIR